MTDLQLYSELSSLPTDLKKEVQNFIEFLKTKARKKTLSTNESLAQQKAFLKCMMILTSP